MAGYLGIDTSNYTTSAALFEPQTNRMLSVRKLLTVSQGKMGLKQSDAVFAHVKQLPSLLEQVMQQGNSPRIAAVGASVRPRDQEGSYMPCFLVGELCGVSAAQGAGVVLHRFSHQCGHIAAALYGAGQLQLRHQPFIAFHVSGGTTECLLVEPSQRPGIPFSVQIVAQSLDLKAGQAIDRVGGMLGLPFPAGRYLDELSCRCEKTFHIRPTMKGMDCCLSGIENQCRKLVDMGTSPQEVAKYCITSVEAAVDAMTAAVRQQYGNLPLLYAGGVMSNTQIQRELSQKYHAYFAPAAYSADNACGIAVLTALAAGERLNEKGGALCED